MATVFRETAEGKSVRLANERKIRRAKHLNTLRSKFRSRGIKGTVVSRRGSRRIDFERDRKKTALGRLRTSTPSLLGG